MLYNLIIEVSAKWQLKQQVINLLTQDMSFLVLQFSSLIYLDIL